MHDDDVDDEPEEPASEATASAAPPVTMTDEELGQKLHGDLASLGSMSVGTPSAGALVNGVRMPPGDAWVLVDPDRAWGTQETVDDLTRCIAAVHVRFPGSPKAYIGHVSARGGGHLSPHKSHQAGRDVDVSYYLESGHKWYGRATAQNLDRARTWALVRAAITDTDVEFVLIDSSIQKLLKEYAATSGEDPAWLDDVFQYGSRSKRPLIRHAKGHATHLHLRFYSPVAQELGRRAFPVLAEQGKIKATVQYAEHKAKKGETLGSLARRYGTTVKAIQDANRMRSTMIHAGQSYRLPGTGTAVKRPPPAAVPPRRLPPANPAVASTSGAPAASP